MGTSAHLALSDKAQKRRILRDYSLSLSAFARISDVLIVIIAGFIAYYLRFDGAIPQNLPQNYMLVLVFSAFLSMMIFPWFGLYRSWRGQSLIKHYRTVLLALGTVLMMDIFIMFLLKSTSDFSRIWIVSWYLIAAVLILSFRSITYAALRWMRQEGLNHKSVVIVGAGDLGVEVLKTINASTWSGFDVDCFFDDNISLKGKDRFGVKIQTELDQLDDYVKENSIDEVWLALPLRAEERMKTIINSLSDSVVNIRLIPDIFGMSILNHAFTEIAGMPVVDLCTSPMVGINRVIKSVEDFILALIILVLISPLMVTIAISIKLTSKGPVIFKQKRNGWDGKIIKVYKFRSMKVHKEFDGTITQAFKKDPRITKVGAFLRRTSLDELPQFFNVLQGRMSIVGPRPHAVEHNEQYRQLVDQYMLRHKMKPGITGWAQVNGYRGETDTLDKMKKRVEFDLFYIENWSLWLDIKIILLTIFRGFINKNAY